MFLIDLMLLNRHRHLSFEPDCWQLLVTRISVPDSPCCCSSSHSNDEQDQRHNHQNVN